VEMILSQPRTRPRNRSTPFLGDDGYVRWIINRADDVTELVELRNGVSGDKCP
jgi:hypothetical protein